MADIYDIKYSILWDITSISKTILVCLVFFCLYFWLFRKKIIKSDQIAALSVKNIEEVKIDYKELISKFEKNYLSLDSKNFLKEISIIFRSFLEQNLWYKNFSKLTLKEIVENWELRGENLELKFLRDIYFKEYKEEKLTDKEKEKIFLKVKDIILKNV